MFRRALLAFLALPGIVAFVVPLLIASADASNRSVSTSGVPVVLTGILLLLWCVRDFFVIGKGTLAPWDPPKRLVMVGLYRHVRNPMYVSVVVLVTGWALVFTSRQLAAYAIILALGFHVRVLVHEEPRLARQFGDDWRDYRAHVRRWLPRLTPWSGEHVTTRSSVVPFAIVHARPADVAAIPAIEIAAARLLEGHAPAAVLAGTTDDDDLHEAQAEGRLWVALDGDTPVGFALVETLSPRRAHLEEIDVLPSHGRRGIGAALVRAACDWAARAGFEEVTLTTFREVRWNMPFYAKLGFVEVPAARLDAELETIVRDEEARGLPRDRRAVMRYALCDRPLQAKSGASDEDAR